ncbi:MAG: hypothetical protein ACFCVH_16700 [Alphaproteobacteria bacterium]
MEVPKIGVAARVGRPGTEWAVPRAAWYPISPLPSRQKPWRVDVELHGMRATVSGAAPTRCEMADVEHDSLKVAISNGLIWACLADHSDRAILPIDLHGFGARDIVAMNQVTVSADFDQVVLGLVDPAHVPMVHNSWWWRSGDTRKVKTKQYGPSPLGFTASAKDRRHASPLFRLFGLNPDISIEFRLPSLRIERIRHRDNLIANFTFVTPIRPGVQRVYNVMFSTWRWLHMLGPVVRRLGQTFLQQDARILSLIGAGHANDGMLFRGDPDKPSLWYFRLKRELASSQDEGRPFENPIRPQLLTWRT